MVPLPQEVLLNGQLHLHLDEHPFLRLLQIFQGLQHRLLDQHQDYLTGNCLNNQHEPHRRLLLPHHLHFLEQATDLDLDLHLNDL